MLVLICALAGLVAGPGLAGLTRVLADRPATLQDVVAGYRGIGKREVLCGALAAGLFALAAARWGWDLRLLPHLVLFGVSLLFSVIDIERYLIPNRLLVPALYASGILMAVSSLVSGSPIELVRAVAGAVLFFVVMLVFHLLYPAGMGLGDVKLAFLLGLFLGWAGTSIGPALRLTMFGLFFGALFGSIIGAIVLLVVRRKGAFFPYGPSLCAGTLVTLVAAATLVPR